jgi:energy-coupling factor transport system ATP-binding protein
MRENDLVLSVEGLSYAYEEGRPVLQDVSFSVPKGAYVSVIGHNGSGKSTLAKCIMGLLGGFEGKISLFGEELTRKSLYRLRSRVGIVFQNPDNQFVGSTVADDIAFGLENKCVPHEEMQGIIDRFAEEAGMKDFLSHEPQMLSGGQKQRVAIAGVLAMEPELILFDEATAMLDPRGKKEIRELIAKMREKNPDLTLISITHDIEEAAASDQVLVINQGRLVLQGPPSLVFLEEEKLREISLGIPFFYQMKVALIKEGIAIPDDISTLEGLEDYLCR